MKILVVSKGSLELGRAQLNKPIVTIGRSPMCDVVMRAPGLKPVHFFLEWIGMGAFNPDVDGDWSVFDISSATKNEDTAGAASEGVFLSNDDAFLGQFKFKIIEDKLESKQKIGGNIAGDYGGVKPVQPQGLVSNELVQVLEVSLIRPDSGAIEEVFHKPVDEIKKENNPIMLAPEICVGPMTNKVSVYLDTSSLSDGVLFNRGQAVSYAQSQVPITSSDIIKVRLNQYDVYLRVVPRIKIPAVPVEILGDSQERKMYLLAGIVFALFVAALVFLSPAPVLEKRMVDEFVVIDPVVTIVTAPKSAPVKLSDVPEAKPEPKKVEKPKPKIVAVKKQAPKKDLSRPKSAPLRVSRPRKIAPPQQIIKKKAPLDSNPLLALVGSSSSPSATESFKDVSQSARKSTYKKSKNSRSVFQDSGRSRRLVIQKKSNSKNSNLKNLSKGSSEIVVGKTEISSSDVSKMSSKLGPANFSDIANRATRDFAFDASGIVVAKGAGLKREEIRKVIRFNRLKLKACYEKALAVNITLSAKVVFSWTIQPSGRILSGSIRRISDSSGVRGFSNCLQNVISQMKFTNSANGQITAVQYPFVFKAE